jgi:hypothetical protein
MTEVPRQCVSADHPSERHELADRCLDGAGLEAYDEADIERLSEALERREARTVLARLDARDYRVARPHPFGQLLLGESERGAPHDHERATPS